MNHNPLADWFLEGEGGWVYLTHKLCNHTYQCDPPMFLDDLMRLVNKHECK